MTTGRKYTATERTALAAKILKLADEGLTRAVIAERCGCGPNMVSAILREARQSERPGPADQEQA